MAVATEAAAGTRLVGGDHMTVQEHVELGGMPRVAGPGLGVLGSLDAPLAGLEVELLLFGPTPGGTGLGAVAMGHEVTA